MPEESQEELDTVCPPELRSLVKCVFCQNDLTEEADDITGAHLLVCFHSVCKNCVEGWSDSVSKFCPECSVDVPKDLVDHKLLQEMVERPHSESTRKGVCEMHPGIPATRWCNQCNTLVCEDCIKVHYLLIGTSTHEIIDASDILPSSDESLVEFNCKLHPSMQMKIFCIECEMMTCPNCQLEHHKQHNEYEFIDVLCKEYKNELLKTQERMCQSEKTIQASQKAAQLLKSDLLSKKATLTKDISNFYDNIVKILGERCAQLVKQVDTVIDEDIKVIEDKVSSASRMMAPLKHCIQIVDLMLLQASDNTVMHSKKHLEKCFKLLLNRNVELANPDVKKYIYFHPGENIDQLLEQIKNIGQITCDEKNSGNQAMYRPILEQFKLLNSERKKNERKNDDGKTAEKPLNHPARIQLRQDLQSPEGPKSMERASCDSRVSASPEVGGMPHWHTPQEPVAPKLPSQAAKKQPANAPNVVVPSLQLKDLLASNQPQFAQSAPPSYTITQLPRQVPSNAQRMMSQDASGSAMKVLVSGIMHPQQVQCPPMTVPSMQRNPPPVYNYVINQPPTSMTYNNPSGVATLRQSEPPRAAHVTTYQNLLRLNSVSVTPSSAFQQHVQQLQQTVTMQQSAQVQALQQGVQIQSIQQQPAHARSAQHQGLQMNAIQQLQDMAYIPGSTHNPYPQL